MTAQHSSYETRDRVFQILSGFSALNPQTTFNLCYQQRAWCFGLRVHTPGSVRNRIINHARRPKVNDHRGFSLFSQTSKAERTSNFFVTMSARAATRNANLQAARLRPRFSSWGDSLPGPTMARGGQHGVPRHTHRLRVRAVAATPSRPPNLPPLTGRNDSRIKHCPRATHRAQFVFDQPPALPTKWRPLRARKRAGDPAANEGAAAASRPMRRRPPPVAGAGRSECGEDVVVV